MILASLLVFIFIKEPEKQFEEGEKQPNMFQSLQEVMREQVKSGIRILLAPLLLVPVLLRHPDISHAVCHPAYWEYFRAGDAGRLTGHMAVLIVLSAIVAGILGSRIRQR